MPRSAFADVLSSIVLTGSAGRVALPATAWTGDAAASARPAPPTRPPLRGSLFLAGAVALVAAGCSGAQPIGQASSQGPSQRGGQTVQINTPGAEGASCQVTDAVGNSYTAASTPAVVTVRPNSGTLSIICSKPGFRDGSTSATAGTGTDMFDDVSYFFGWSERAPAKGGYPAEIAVMLSPDAAGAMGSLGAGQSLGVVPPGANQSLLGLAPDALPPAAQLPGGGAQSGTLPTRMVSGSALMGAPGDGTATAGRSGIDPAFAGMTAPMQTPLPPPGAGATMPAGMAGQGSADPAMAEPIDPTFVNPAAARPVRASGQAAGRGGYAVQVGAYRDRRNADEIASLLRSRGYDAEVQSAGAVHRVRIGRYAAIGEAQSAAASFVQKERLEAVAVRN